MRHVVRVKIELIWQPKICGSLGLKLWSDDANDEIRLTVELNVRADDARIRPEASLPQSIAEDSRAATVWAIFCSSKYAAGEDRRAEETKVVLGDMHCFQLLGIAAASQIESGAGLVKTSDCVENARLLVPDVEFGEHWRPEMIPAGQCS